MARLHLLRGTPRGALQVGRARGGLGAVPWCPKVGASGLQIGLP